MIQTAVHFRVALVCAFGVSCIPLTYAQSAAVAAAPASSAASATAGPTPEAGKPQRVSSKVVPEDLFAMFPSEMTVQQRKQIFKAARSHGYRPAKFSGSLVYCRDRVPIGSRFPVLDCVDETALNEQIEREEALRDAIRQPRPCVATDC